jgi:hypothetical protein
MRELNNVDVIEKYGIVLNNWTLALEPKPSKRDRTVATPSNGSIHATGCKMIQETFKENELYPPKSCNWIQNESMSTKIIGSAANSGNKIYAIGQKAQQNLTDLGLIKTVTQVTRC